MYTTPFLILKKVLKPAIKLTKATMGDKKSLFTNK